MGAMASKERVLTAFARQQPLHPTAVTAAGATAPVALDGCSYPNPCNGPTQIGLRLLEDSRVSVRVFAVDGQVVRTLLEGALAVGERVVIWETCDERGQRVGSGVYFLQVRSGEQRFVARIAVLP
ncbi:MAG: T9SS type A sorting domain-containing protein [Candidatus Latescibacterota bacterium]